MALLQSTLISALIYPNIYAPLLRHSTLNSTPLYFPVAIVVIVVICIAVIVVFVVFVQLSLISSKQSVVSISS